MLRRGTAWAMLALYSLVVSGLPLPVAAPPAGSAAAKQLAGKDRSRPFPCMDKACGCDTAEKCFSSCCCHTPAETLAWAKAHGIEPRVLEALARRVATAPAEPPSASCCSAAADADGPSCCETAADEDPDEALCSDYQSLAAEPTTCCRDAASEDAGKGDLPTDAPPTKRVVVLRAMLACGGLVAQWTSMGTSLPPPAIVTCDLPWPQVDVLAVDDARVVGTATPPDLPPPRCS